MMPDLPAWGYYAIGGIWALCALFAGAYWVVSWELSRERQNPPAKRPPPTIAEQAIDLFLEYRDVHGYSEERAKNQALIDMAEAALVEIPPLFRASGRR